MPVCGILLPEQKAAGQVDETEGGGEQRKTVRAAEKCKKHQCRNVFASCQDPESLVPH